MGDSGVGKTSLLRAGLSDILDKRNIRLIYWEAQPTNPRQKLLYAIRARWDTTKDAPPRPNNIAEAVRALSTGPIPTVIVLDQFEQLSPKNPTQHKLFKIVKRFATSGMAPYRLTWIIAFRRECGSSWLEFEHTELRFFPPMLPLEPFEKDPAQALMAALATSADFTLDNQLIADTIDAVADQDGHVSPVDIGISMLVLNGLAIRKNKKHLNKDDYRFAGGAEGILTYYVGEWLKRFEGERQGVMKALLALSDLGHYQRIAEGKTVAELSTVAQLSPNRLSGYLERLAAPNVRLLERMPTAAESLQKYRLPHDRIVASLRRLTGLILAEADQAQLIFEHAFRSWLNGRSRRFLLTGADLEEVLKNRDRLYGGILST